MVKVPVRAVGVGAGIKVRVGKGSKWNEGDWLGAGEMGIYVGVEMGCDIWLGGAGEAMHPLKTASKKGKSNISDIDFFNNFPSICHR